MNDLSVFSVLTRASFIILLLVVNENNNNKNIYKRYSVVVFNVSGWSNKWHPCRTDFPGATANFNHCAQCDVDGGVRTPVGVHGIVTQKHNRWDRIEARRMLW